MIEIIQNIIGFTAGGLISINLVPQIVKSLKTKQVEDLSMSMIMMVLAGSLLWLIYGLMLMSGPIIFSDGFGSLTTMILLAIKLKYTGKK